MLARFEMPRALTESGALAPQAETAQPLYARYWLHNRGPRAARWAAGRRPPAPRSG